MPDGKVNVISNCKVVGIESIKVGAKTYSALKVTETGTTTGASTLKLVTSTWLVKGVGPVKIEIKRTPKGGPPVNLTMTLE